MSVFHTPNAQIRVEGQLLSAEMLHALSGVRVQQVFSLPAQCELVFINPPVLNSLLETFRPGTAIKVSATAFGDWIFEGETSVLEQQYGPAGQMELRVRGYDLLNRLRKHHSQRIYQNVGVSALASQLCGELGTNLTVSIRTSEDARYSELIQSGQTDFDFLRQVADRRGLYFSAKDGIVEFFRLNGGGEAATLHLGENLLEARFETSTEAASYKVRVGGWSPETAEAYAGDADQAQVRMSAGGNGSGLRLEDREAWNGVAFDERHAQAAAQAELDRRAAHSMHVWGVAEGDPGLYPGAVVSIEGVDASVRGSYMITAATHILSATRGYQTEFSTLPPAPPQSPVGTGMTLGIVSNVDDPQKLGRVRVLLPAFGEFESSWMHVVLPAAGDNKGLMILPAPDDTVLVLFPMNEPTQGFVLGGLYGMQGMPDTGVEGSQVKRYTLLTSGGQRITLDDAGQKIRMEDSGGSFIELSPERAVLHAAVDLLMEAPGRRVVIKGQNIDFERG